MKKTNKFKITGIIAIAAIVLLGSACSDFFDQSAGNQVSPDNHYKSVVDLQYVSMPGVLSPLKDAAPSLILIDGLLSDQMQITDNADGYMQDINDHILSIDNPYLNTSDYYKVIINANEVLQNLYKISEIDPDFDEYYITSYTNYLVGIRAWAYFTLVKLNGKAAWIEDNMLEIPAGKLNYIDKAPLIDTLINQLLPLAHLDDDLDELDIPLFPNTKALLGELYLEKNDYANAIEYFVLGMESFGNEKDRFKVDKTFQKDNWFNIFLSAESQITENISIVPYRSTEGQYNPVTGWTIPTGIFAVKPSNILAQSFVNQVPVKGPVGDTYRGIGFSIDTLSAGDYYIKKYSLDEAEPYGADIILSRASDIHLMLAEAYNRMGDPNTALVFVNDGWSRADKVPSAYRKWNTNMGVRGRVTLAPATVPVEITDPNQIMLAVEDIIMDERALELAFEGKRYFDLMRIARRRGDNDYLAKRVAMKFEGSKVQQIRELLWNDSNWYIPIND